MIKPFRGLLVMLSLMIETALAADEWIGLDTEAPTIVGFQYSEEEQGNRSNNLYLSLPIGLTASLDFDYSQTELIDDDIRFDSDSLVAALNLDINDMSAILMGYQFQGQRDEIEIDLFDFQLSFHPDHFSAQLGYSFGELVVFTQQDILPDLNFPEEFRSDMDVVEFGFGWWFENLGIAFNHRSYDYQENVSALGSRRLLKLLVKPAALVQSDLLLKKQTIISLQYFLAQRSLAWHWSSSRSELDGSSDVQSIQMDWTEIITGATGLLISVGRSDDNIWFLGLGLEWTL